MSEEASKTPLIYSLIPKIAADIGVVGKSRKNQQQNYNFRGIEDVVDAAHPAFTHHGVFLTTEILERTREERPTKSGGTMLYTTLRVRFTFYAPDGSNVETEAEGEGMDSGDKSTNKAASAALKYALGQMLLIPFNMTDSEDNNPEPAPRQQRHGERDEQDQRPEPQANPQDALFEAANKWLASITATSDPVILGGRLAHLTQNPKPLVDAVMPHFLAHIKALGFALKPGTFEIVHADSFTQELSQCSDLNQMNALFNAKVNNEKDKKLAIARYNEMLTYATKCSWVYNKDAKAFEPKTVRAAEEPSHDELAAEAKAMGW